MMVVLDRPGSSSAGIADTVPTGPTLAASLATFARAKVETNAEVIEAEEFVGAMYDAIASRTHVYAAGAAGTGKTFGANIMGQHFGVPYYYTQFRNGMKREEVVGPLSMTKLQDDLYVHVTTRMLPEAVLANLDEIADAGRFNRELLTMLNERWFVNGPDRLDIPLATAIATTNFWMDAPELDALFDRFPQRLTVTDVTSAGFARMLDGACARAGDELAGRKRDAAYTIVSAEQLSVIQRAVLECMSTAGPAVKDAAVALRTAALGEGLEVSGRRYIDGLKLAAARAVQAGRDHIVETDLRVFSLILRNAQDDHVIAAQLTNHLRDPLTTVIEEATRGLAEVREALTALRKCRRDGTPIPAEAYGGVAKTTVLTKKVLEKVEDGRRTLNAGQPHPRLDELAAALRDELTFMSQVITGVMP